jgi:hypothetical protein
MLHRADWQMFIDVSDLPPASVIKKIAQGAITSKAVIHTYRRENLKPHIVHLSSRFSFQYKPNNNIIQKHKSVLVAIRRVKRYCLIYLPLLVKPITSKQGQNLRYCSM